MNFQLNIYGVGRYPKLTNKYHGTNSFLRSWGMSCVL